jgi:pimeloyl-ACP methyl ester carboxylesterase
MVKANSPPPAIPLAPRLPTGASEQYADLSGTRLWYARWTRHAAREPVLLLHGGLMNSNYFGYLIPALTNRGYDVIAADSRSQGRSPYAGHGVTYDAMEQDVVALLDHLDVGRVSLVGWSDGGIIGLQLAMHRPERLSRLFSFGANTHPSGNIEDTDSLPTMIAHAALEREEYLALSPTPAAWDQVRAAVVQMWRMLPAITGNQLNTIRVPTTISVGEHDECIKPEHTRYIAAQIPDSALNIMPGVSHFGMLQSPALFNQTVLDFLSDKRTTEASAPVPKD